MEGKTYFYMAIRGSVPLGSIGISSLEESPMKLAEKWRDEMFPEAAVYLRVVEAPKKAKVN